MSLKTALTAIAAIALAGTSNIAAAQSAPPLEAYGDLPAIEDGALSPSGAHAALLMTVGGQRQILVFDGTGAPIKQFVVGDAKVRWIEWAGDQAVVLARTETQTTRRRWGPDKREYMRVNVLPMDDRSPVVSVFADQNYIGNNVVVFDGIRQVDGRWKGFFGGFQRGRTSGNKMDVLSYRPALYAVDLITGEPDLVSRPSEEDDWRDWIVGDDGKIAAMLDVDVKTGKWRLENGSGDLVASGTNSNGTVDLIGLDADGSSIIYQLRDDDQEQRQYFSVPASGGETTQIWQGQIIHRLIGAENSSRILGFITPENEVVSDDPQVKSKYETAIGTFSNSVIDIVDKSAGISSMMVSTSGNYDSGTWYRLDPSTGGRMMMGLERPAIQGPIIGKIETFEYQAQDGLEIEAILTLPPGKEAKDLPVIVMPHGGPSSHDEAEFHYDAQAFASRGYAVLQPNFRGSTNRDEAFRAAGGGEWGRKMQTDLSDGLAALAEKGVVDPSRACIMGASYGGYAALAGVTLQQGLYRCAVSVNGVTDLEEMFDSAVSGENDVFRRENRRILGDGADLVALSPNRLAGKADAPILLIHGKDDTVVPYAQSKMMQDSLKDAGKPVEFLTLEGEDHWLSQPASRQQMLKAAVAFVQEHNPAD